MSLMERLKAGGSMLYALMTGMQIHTDGIWSYIKLPNGIAICWGIATETQETNIPVLGGYRGEGVYIKFPEGLFIGTPVGVADGYTSTYGIVSQSRPLNKDTFYWNQLVDVNTTLRLTAQLIAIGRWK